MFFLLTIVAVIITLNNSYHLLNIYFSPGTALGTLYMLTHLIFSITLGEIGVITIFTLQMRKLRLQRLSNLPKVTQLANGGPGLSSCRVYNPGFMHCCLMLTWVRPVRWLYCYWLASTEYLGSSPCARPSDTCHINHHSCQSYTHLSTATKDWLPVQDFSNHRWKHFVRLNWLYKIYNSVVYAFIFNFVLTFFMPITLIIYLCLCIYVCMHMSFCLSVYLSIFFQRSSC